MYVLKNGVIVSESVFSSEEEKGEKTGIKSVLFRSFRYADEEKRMGD